MIKKITSLIILLLFIISINTHATSTIFENNAVNDIDPLIDLQLSVKINEIRALDEFDTFSDPDFYVKLIINDEEYFSPTWKNKKMFDEGWEKTVDVDDTKEYVNIKIQLWEDDPFGDTLCDIAKNDNDDAERLDLDLYYSLKTGHWSGDDMIYSPHAWEPDYSGYGRGNGCDDGSIYENDKDCEIFFDIFQSDYDGDGIPYWTEVNIFETDPEVDDTGRDDDSDGVPIEWEYKWGYRLSYDHKNHTTVPVWEYDPFIAEDHEELNPDMDSLNNIEEYLTSKWGSDPFRKDVFVELDEMQAGPNGEPASILPNGSKELIKKAFNRQNIVFHLDDGEMGGSEMIPFDNQGDNTTHVECNQIYNDYFLHGNNSNWKKGVFHYGVVVYNSTWPGFNFRVGGFQISKKHLDEKYVPNPFFSNDEAVVYGSCYMHELGHSLGLTWLGGHVHGAGTPLHPLWWKFRPYKSIMNYGYMYGPLIWRNLVDYSDGSRGKNDFDDWSNIDFSYIKQ